MDKFTHEMGAKVRLIASDELGVVTARSEFNDSDPQYRVLYKSADGRQVESWWSGANLAAA